MATSRFSEEQLREAGEFIRSNLSNPALIAEKAAAFNVTVPDILAAANAVNAPVTAAQVTEYFRPTSYQPSAGWSQQQLADAGNFIAQNIDNPAAIEAARANVEQATGLNISSADLLAAAGAAQKPAELSRAMADVISGDVYGNMNVKGAYDWINQAIIDKPQLSAQSAQQVMRDLGISGRDVAQAALLDPRISAGAQYALVSNPLYQQGQLSGLAALNANINSFITNALQYQTPTQARQSLQNALQSGVLTAGRALNEYDVQRATGKSLNDLFKTAVQGPQVLGPLKALPDLTGSYVPPTAPPPEAPPSALTPGQEGLDPGTAIVGNIPTSAQVRIPQLDAEFRASAPRTAVYDRLGRVSGYEYTPAAKLTPATGTTVFNWTPPGVTSRPRQLLSRQDVPGATFDPVTGEAQMPLSASQRFARDRAQLDRDFRQMYAAQAAQDSSLPAQAPASAAQAFRELALSDPETAMQLKLRDIEQQRFDPAKADMAVQPAQAAVSNLFAPFINRNMATLQGLAKLQNPVTYAQRRPDVAAAYAKLSAEEKKNFPTLLDYEVYHYNTYGKNEDPTLPNPLEQLGKLQSPYATAFLSKGGEASTEDFIKKQSGGDVSRETASPETRGVSSLKGYGEGEEAASIRRSAREALRGLMGMRPYEETNPSEAYRIASTATPLTMIGGGIRGIKRIAGSEEAAKAIGKAAEAAGMKAPVTAAKSLTTLDDFHLSLGDQIRKRSADMQDLIESTPFKYSIGDRVFTADSARKNRPPLEILNRVMVGNDPMREGHPILGKVVKDPETGKTKRTPYEPGYEVLLFEGKDNWTKFRIPESAIKGVIDPIEPLEKQDGGEASTEEFIKKNVSRETTSPNTAEVPKVDAEGRLIDEREEIRSESQRMLNRLQSQPSKLPPGLRRTVAATREQGKESMFPAAAPARDLLSGILGASPTAPGSEAYRTGQAIANMPPVQAAAAIPAKIAASAGDAATALAAMGPAVGAVMKPKGGNWLAPSVERGLNYLIPRTGAGNRTAKETLEEMNRTYPAEDLARMSPETRASVDRAYQWLEPNVAIQNWIEKKLTKYVKNEMATPEDPVRALAERGILHVDPEQLNSYPGAGNPANQAVSRRALGYPEEGLAKSEAAKRWETASDYMIQTDRANNLLEPTEYGQGFVDQTLAANPWLTKVDPYERIYGVDTLNYRPDYSELGFDHLIDELKNSLNPNSGLPRSLQLTPKQLDKVSMPQAVELVDKINKWRAEQKAAADLKRSQNAATVEYKAYETIPGTAEPNKRGLRWVELKPATMSEDFVAPDRYSIVRPTPSSETFAIQDSETGKYITTGLKSEEQARKHLFDTLNRQQLEDALKYEGEVMGHCVGGYCPDVQEGRSRIYSLRDAKGEPHVTIEVKPNPSLIRHNEIIDELRRSGFDLDSPNVASWDDSEYEAAYNAAQKALESRRPAVIAQIKGKANRAPKDEYLPFVQDFVRSGNWSNVQDLKNAGLSKVGNKYITTEEYKSLVDPAMRYLEQSPALEPHRRAQRELDDYQNTQTSFVRSPKYQDLRNRAGMLVHPRIPYTYREMTSIFRDPEAYGPDSLGENLERVNLLRQLYGEEGFAQGGSVNVPRETSTSKQQLDKLAQVSQRKKA